jgi:hypothetical protein
MTAVLKTWPASMDRHRVREAFTHDWGGSFYFTLGRGKPSRKIDQLYFTHASRILGYFDVAEVIQNVGQLPRLRSISGEVSEWQIRPDSWVAVCNPPFHFLEEKLYYCGFRGFRFFDIDAYRGTMEAKIPL